MKKRVIQITTNEQIQNCMISKSVARVWIQDEYYKQGSIDKFDDGIICSDCEYYNECFLY